MGEIYGMIEETKNKGGSGLELCDIGMALYVDETKGLRRYLNGQIVDINTNTQAFLNRLKQITTLHPSLLCTEEEWQTAKTMSAFGQVGKFVFNYSGDEVVSVRLPRVVNVQGLFDLQKLGMTVEAGLPNITGSQSFGTWRNNRFESAGLLKQSSGCVGPASKKLPSGGNSTQGFDTNTDTLDTLNIDASLSNPIYGNSTTVQPEAIQYPYFIQIATGSETEANITNKFENTNPQTLLESKYSDKPLYNESWLLSNGQYNLKATYPTAYEGLQVEYNSEIEAGTTVTLPSGVSYTKRGLSVKLSTETYTDYDFVLNTADEKFRLPLQVKQKFYNAVSGNYPVVGNGMTLGLYGHNQDNVFVEACLRDVNHNIVPNSLGVGVSTDSYNRNLNTNGLAGTNFGVTKDPTKSGLVAKLSSTEVSGLYLYFYVGDIDQNHGIVNMGRIGEQVASLTTVVETYQNGTSGYRVWSDGYCEQWGIFDRGSDITSSSPFTITLLKSYNNTLYTPIVINGGNSSGGGYGWHIAANKVVKTATSFEGYAWKYETSNRFINWETKGYIS